MNKYKEAGTGAVEGFKGSMAEQREQLEAYVENYFAGMGDSAKKGIQVNSPSKVFQKIGLAVGEGFRLGMEQDKPKAERTVLDYFQKMIATVKAETRKLNLEFALAQGDTLTISTLPRQKQILLNGENAMMKMDRTSDLTFALTPGDNLLCYEAADGRSNMDVRLYYTPEYLGV